MRYASKTLILLTTVAFVTACGSSSEPARTIATTIDPHVAQTNNSEIITRYRERACRFAADDGEMAQALNANAAFANSYFGKTVQTEHLMAVARASATETVRFIELLGVRVFKVPSTVADCHIFASLSEAPAVIQEKWNARQDHAEGGMLVGLYLSEDEAGDGLGPAILVRDDSNRWTLVHEFMHHLFRQELRSSDLTVRQLAEATNSQRQSLAQWEAQAEAGDFSNWAGWSTSYRDYFVGLDRQLKHTELEELAVETTLAELFIQGRLQFVPESPRSSQSYGLETAGAAEEAYQAVLNRVAGRAEAREQGLVQEVAALVTERRRQMAEALTILQNWAESR